MAAVPADKPTPFTRLRRYVKRTLQGLAGIIGVYLLILLIGLIPVNNDFEPTAGGIPIYVISSSVHADIILPLSHPEVDLREEFPEEFFSGNTAAATHVGFGWGDTGFYVHTPTWDDLNLSTAANSLFIPSECCLHVQLYRDVETWRSAKSVRLSPEQYRQLVNAIQQSFKTDLQGQKILIPNSSYGPTDIFFVARGNYHLLNTCNSWAGDILRSAGIRAPLLTPLPGTPTLYFPDQHPNSR